MHTIPPRPQDLKGKLSQSQANDRFSNKLAEAYTQARVNPNIESRLYVDNDGEILLAFSTLFDITKLLNEVDLTKTVAVLAADLKRGASERTIELLNGSAILMAIKPEILRPASR